MGYYTIWLAPVKRIFVPFWELRVSTKRQVPAVDLSRVPRVDKDLLARPF